MPDGFANAVVGGAETLIRTAIKSFGYVAGVFGWRIARDGTAEFNNITARGSITADSVSAGGGTVLVNSGGVAVLAIGGNFDYEINRTAGFIARNVPDNGAISQLSVGQVTFIPTVGNPTPGGKTVTGRGQVIAEIDTIGAEDNMRLTLNSGTVNGQSNAVINLYSEGSGGGYQPYIQLNASNVPGSVIECAAETVTINHKLYSGQLGMYFCPLQIWTQTTLVTNNGGTGQTRLSVASAPFPAPFPAGTTVFGWANVTSITAGSTGWVVRFIPVSNTNYALEIQNASGGVPAGGINVTYTIFATAIPI